jgi:DNA-binding transcriptional LysR family regulator
MMLEACEAGARIAKIVEFGSHRLIESGKLVELFPDWAGEIFPLCALYPSRHYQPAKVKAFLDFCAEACNHT